jgi:vacuolar-type H+-ATPase subunit H
MQEIIDSIIAAEREAKLRLSEASKNSDAIKAKADADAGALVSRAREEAAAELRRRTDAARRNAEEKYLEARRALEHKAESLYASLGTLVPGMAADAARLAMKTELEP